VKAIADTGFVVAFGNRNDRYHSWAVAVGRSLSEPALTCEAVLSEAAFHLASSAYVLELVANGMLQIPFEWDRQLPQLAELAIRYRDREPDLADLCVIRMSELYLRHTVITTDESHFRVYRRNKRDTIPILTPSSASRC
jgi:predicted nucleic acid-binding protein